MPIYMKFGSMTGDAQVTGHEQWIELNSFQWGIGRSITSSSSSSSDREGSTPSVGEIVVTKDNDSTSPSLYGRFNSGGLRISIVNGKPGKEPLGHTIELANAVITEVQWMSSGGAKPKPRERVKIRFSGYSLNGLANVPVPPSLGKF